MPCKVEQTNEPDPVMEAPKRPKENPAPLGIWGGGGGSEDYPKAGKGGEGGARGEEDGRGRG